MALTLPEASGPTAAERFAPLLSRAESGFGADVTADWVHDLQQMQWNQIRNIFFAAFLLDPPRDRLSKKHIKELFDEADEDHNGELDRDEVTALVERAHIEAFHKQLDLLVALAHRFSPRLDTLKDDAVERSLRTSYDKALLERKEAGSLQAVANRFFDSLDKNADGSVSRREFVSGYLSAFQAAQGKADERGEWDRNAWKESSSGAAGDKLAFYRRAAAGADNPEAKHALAMLLAGEDGVPIGEDGERLARDVALREEYEILREAVALAHHGATYRLAIMYADGRAPAESVQVVMDSDGAKAASVDEFCEAEALRLFQREADLGDSRSAYQLARMQIARGKWPEALEALEKSADRAERREAFDQRVRAGEPDALYTLGARKMLGTAFERPSTADAVALFRKAAEKGQPDALNTMAILHYVGMGKLVPKDQRVARDYWQMAANCGHKKAKELYESRKQRDDEAAKDAEAAERTAAASAQSAHNEASSRGTCAVCTTEGDTCIVS